jgi:hypothetical protein
VTVNPSFTFEPLGFDLASFAAKVGFVEVRPRRLPMELVGDGGPEGFLTNMGSVSLGRVVVTMAQLYWIFDALLIELMIVGERLHVGMLSNASLRLVQLETRLGESQVGRAV